MTRPKIIICDIETLAPLFLIDSDLIHFHGDKKLDHLIRNRNYRTWGMNWRHNKRSQSATDTRFFWWATNECLSTLILLYCLEKTELSRVQALEFGLFDMVSRFNNMAVRKRPEDPMVDDVKQAVYRYMNEFALSRGIKLDPGKYIPGPFNR